MNLKKPFPYIHQYHLVGISWYSDRGDIAPLFFDLLYCYTDILNTTNSHEKVLFPCIRTDLFKGGKLLKNFQGVYIHLGMDSIS